MAVQWCASWNLEEYVQEFLPSLNNMQSRNLVSLFKQKFSLPFIARYNADRTGGLAVEKLHQAYDLYKEAVNLNRRIKSMVFRLSKDRNVDESVLDIVKQSKSNEEIISIQRHLGMGRHIKYANLAVAAGLRTAARSCLDNGRMFNSRELISKEYPTEEDVRGSVALLINQMLLAKPSVKDLLNRFEQRDGDHILVTVIATSSTKRLIKESTALGFTSESKTKSDFKNVQNFSAYVNFRSRIGALKPHQVMAINRGVKAKVLRRKFTVPPTWSSEFIHEASSLTMASNCKEAKVFIVRCIHTCYKKTVQPRLIHRMWNKATKLAHSCAVECFAKNLKSLLLTEPLKGHSIVGIDPGFTHGCKYAMISPQGEILCTGVFYLPQVKNLPSESTMREFCDLVVTHRCDRIGIGNGKGGQETFVTVRGLMRQGRFKPLDVQCR
uniref:YqgF/RNase H-like domain-containing protein n=1 Tax=Trichuris muris TaxID=70415 RepID=A0A5S6Q492_TRIMR